MTDIQTEASVSSEIEKGNSPTLAFLNDDVASLSWQDLSVKVSDRVTGLDKYIHPSIQLDRQTKTEETK